MQGNAAAILSSIFFTCLVLHPAYALSFNDYESASFLAKIPEVKVETELIATHPGDKNAISYYVNLLNRYWTPTDTKNLNERNPQLASEIAATINDTIAQSEAGNGDRAYSDFFTIAGDMEQAGLVRVDPIQTGNSTIQIMSFAMVLRESLERYGDAIGSSQLSNLSSMNTNNIQSGVTSTGTQIVNEYAYDNSKELAKEANIIYEQLVTHAGDKQVYNDKIGYFMTKYISDLDSKADPNTLISDVYAGMYPNFVEGYKMNPESVPEFPFPSVMIAVMMFAVVAARFGLKKI